MNPDEKGRIEALLDMCYDRSFHVPQEISIFLTELSEQDSPEEQGPKLIQATLEPNYANETCAPSTSCAGSAVTLYVKGRPDRQELKEFFNSPEAKRLPLTVDTNDPHFEAFEVPNNLSRYSVLRRYQGFPTG